MVEKTVQLRRYRVIDDLYEDFLAWWQATMPALRTSAGFTVEFAYAIPASHEFVWAVSAPGTAEDFLRLETEYQAANERSGIFAGLPQRLRETQIELIDVIRDRP